jgi:SPP1 family predicted phage head-tail adaptor
MSITQWFDTIFTAVRNEWTTDDDGTPLVTTDTELDDITGNLQQASPEFAEAMQMEFRKTFVLYTSYTADIQEGDKLTSGGNEYTVAGVQRFYHEKVGNQHTKAILKL